MAIDPKKPVISGDPNRPQPSRDRGPAAWLWIGIIIVVIIVFWFAVGGSSRHRNALANPAPQQGQQNSSANAITDAAQLTSGNPKDLVGRPVQLAAAKVDESANGGAFLIDSDGTPVLVVLATAAHASNPGTAMRPAETGGGAWKKDHPAAGEQVRTNGAGQLADQGKGTPSSGGNAAPLTQEDSRAYNRGDLVSIQGTIRHMPSEHDAMVDFNLSTDAAARASHSKVFIEASKVETAAK